MEVLKRAVRSGLRKYGREITRIPSEDSRPTFRRKVILDSLDLGILIDIGADRGGYSREARNAGFRGSLLSVEPRREAHEALVREASADPGWRCVCAAIGAEDGEATIHVAGRRTSSSMLQMLPEHERVAPGSGFIGEESVRIVRLDTLLKELDLSGLPAYLKIDVQGYEREVLSGAERTLEDVRAVEVEMSTKPLYQGGILIRELIDFLDDRGFRPVSFDDVLREPGTGFVLQVDGIFVR